MSILKHISKYSTLLMPICSVAGFMMPDLANHLLPWLDEILFFLMFFTLLGIDQKALFSRVLKASVWRFALLANVGVCLLISSIAYIMGARGDLLLAIAAFGATAPLFGSGAIVNAMGFDALRTMAKVIACTLLMPFVLFAVLYFLAADDASLDIAAYVQRLFIYIVCPIVLSVLIKQHVSKQLLAKYYPKIAQFNILLVLAFPFGLVGRYRATFDNDPQQAILLFVIANLLTVGVFIITFIAYLKANKQRAIIAATVNSGRNMLLTYTISMPFIGSLFLPLVGAIQLPMCMMPFIAKAMIQRYHSTDNKCDASR